MYVLLEPGVEIYHGDEFYNDEEEGWEFTNQPSGTIYVKFHFPMRRKIDTLQQLSEFLKEIK